MTDDQNATKLGFREGVRQRRARVLYSYTPANDDELELQVNDVIKVLEEVEEGWWRGILRGKEGVFPSNFVVEESGDVFEPSKGIDKEEEKESSTDTTDGSKLSSANQEIKPKPVRGVGLGNIFQDGVKKLKSTETAADKTPSVHPKKLPQPLSAVLGNAPKLPPKPVREQARVLYPYEAQNDDELSLKEGEIITVITKEVEDKGWWKGELNGQIGVFPDNFVELVRVEEVQLRKPERPEKPSITVLVSKTTTKPDIPEKPALPQDLNVTDKPSKIPPPKPPAPDLPKRDEKPERPSPPLPGKKPQVPPPMKKPQRSSLGSKPSTGSLTNVSSNISCSSPPPIVNQSSSVALTNGTIGITDDMKAKSLLQENQDGSIDESTFDAIESSPEKLTHLAANRAKAPNRRPPSRIFINKEIEKENGDLGANQSARFKETTKNQDKRSSQSESLPVDKVSTQNDEQHNKIISPLLNSATVQKEEIKSSNQSVVSPVKEISKTPPLPSDKTERLVNSRPTSTIPPISTDLENDITDLKKEIQILREVTVSKEEYAELQKQIEVLKETVESQRSYFSNLVVDLISEIDEEKKIETSPRSTTGSYKKINCQCINLCTIIQKNQKSVLMQFIAAISKVIFFEISLKNN